MDVVEEIKNRLELVAVINDYITLKKAGSNYRGLCPFHSEKTPSFFVSPSKQMWHCFGCGEGYDIFDFVMKIEGIDFKEALKILAQKAGVTLINQPSKLKSNKQKLYEICEATTKFFEDCLENPKTGTQATQYISDRGISKLSIKKWRLGYCPSYSQSFFDFLTKTGYNNREVEKAGLIIKKQVEFKTKNQEVNRINYYSRFQGRIMFPIFNLQGGVVAFGGRLLNTNIVNQKRNQYLAKYINSPTTEIYNKSSVLYGLSQARLEIKKKNFCILVEGYTDVIMSSQVKVENVVSISGTALTNYQLDILKRYTENLIISFDADNPGINAAQKSINLSQEKNFNIKIANLANKKDPAEIILESPNDWRKAIVQSLPIVDFYFKTALFKHNPESPENKKEIAKIVLPVIKKLNNKIEQSYWLQKLSEEIKIDIESIKQELKKIDNQKQSFDQKHSSLIKNQPLLNKKPRHYETLEERLLFLILKNPEVLLTIPIKKYQNCSQYFQEIFLKLKEIADKEKIIIDNLKKYFNIDVFNQLIRIYLKIDLETEKDKSSNAEKNSTKEIGGIFIKLKENKLKKQMSLVTQNIKQAEKEGKTEKVEKLSLKYYRLSKKLKNKEDY